MAHRRTLFLLLAFYCVAVVCLGISWVDNDPVVLTVTGQIARSNRGATDEFADAFFRYHDITFRRGFAFTRRDLEKLGSHELGARYPGKDLSVRVEGPLLSDVLDALGATGTKATVMAFDGYAVEIPLAELPAMMPDGCGAPFYPN